MTNPNFNKHSVAIPSQSALNKRPVDAIFPDRAEAIKNHRCIAKPIGCGGNANSFKDELSAKEYKMSAFCQKCQDKLFGGDHE